MRDLRLLANRLFVPVSLAEQHARHKGIIRRDMKPSNVMVCIYDGKPVPKVIDFGVAKVQAERRSFLFTSRLRTAPSRQAV